MIEAIAKDARILDSSIRIFRFYDLDLSIFIFRCSDTVSGRFFDLDPSIFNFRFVDSVSVVVGSRRSSSIFEGFVLFVGGAVGRALGFIKK